MKVLFVSLTCLAFLSCSSKQMLNLSKNENVSIPPATDKDVLSKPVMVGIKSEDEKLLAILEKLQKNINNKTYLMSDVVPYNSIVKNNSAISFYTIPNDSSLASNNTTEIELKLINNQNYGAYYFSISYPKDKKRTWLFSLDLSEKQLEKQLRKTLLRFAFQSL